MYFENIAGFVLNLVRNKLIHNFISHFFFSKVPEQLYFKQSFLDFPNYTHSNVNCKWHLLVVFIGASFLYIFMQHSHFGDIWFISVASISETWLWSYDGYRVELKVKEFYPPCYNQRQVVKQQSEQCLHKFFTTIL